MTNLREDITNKQSNKLENLRDVRIDARTTVIAEELLALEKEFSSLHDDTTPEGEKQRRVLLLRINKNKDFLASLHHDGFREAILEDSVETLRTEADRLSLEIAKKEAELKRLQKKSGTINDMFTKRDNESPNDIVVRKKESLALIQALLLQKGEEVGVHAKQNNENSIGVNKTILQGIKELDQLLEESANETPANDGRFSSDPSLSKLIILRRSINEIAGELESASYALDRLQKEYDDLKYIVNATPKQKLQLEQDSSKNILSLHTKVQALSRKLLAVLKEQQEEISAYLQSQDGSQSKSA